MTKNGQTIAAGGALAAIAAFGIYLALGERSHHHHHRSDDVPGLPDDSASAPMHGTDWNGPIGLPASSDSAGLPPPAASDSATPPNGIVPPPLSAIPQPTIAPPLDDTMASGQKRRAIEMMQNRLISLQKEADDEERRGATDEAAATRVRIARMQSRLAELQDGGAP